jgi:integrase
LRKQNRLFAVQTAVLESGERLPILKQLDTGEPVYEPLLYSLTELRGANLASNTLLQALRSVMLLLLVLRELKVDLQDRLRKGQFLTLAEVEAVSKGASLALEEIDDGDADGPVAAPNVTSLEAVRMRARRRPLHEVQPGTKAIRLHYIREYLKWLANASLLRAGPRGDTFERLQAARDLVDSALLERTPGRTKRNTEDERQGVSNEVLVRLLEVVRLDSPDNPWATEHNRIRNNLLVRWYALTGVRRSELVAVRVSDINFQTNEVLIARRADAADDPRKEQPLVKTADRLIPLHPELARDTHNYILNIRRKQGSAKRHPFLFVATRSGAPLSISAVNLVFKELRQVPGIPEDLSPHLLRHTWNDWFSEQASNQGYSEETERKIRTRVMGWSENSDTARKYTRRFVRQKSREAMLALQDKMVGGGKDEA